MDRRTRILAGAFLAFVAYALFSSVIYPRWIEPAFTIDERIVERKEVLDELQDADTEVELAKREYGEYLHRIGSLDAVKVENDLRERLNILVDKHGLDDVTTSGGSARMNSLGKSEAQVMTLAVNATGSLASTLGFLKDLAELPHLVRLGNTAIYPASSSRRRTSKDRMYLRVPLEVLVLPQPRILDQRMTGEDLEQSEKYVRHDGRPYSEIWERTPFTHFEDLTANAGRDQTPYEGDSASLRGKATGGRGDHTCQWDPPEGLDDPTSCETKLDTESVEVLEYTLTVTDNRGDTATDTVKVTVRERVVQKELEVEVETEQAAKGPKRDKDGRNMQLCMALIHHEGEERMDEVLVYNSRSKKTLYYEPGAEFDGGTLVYVHPRGAVVRRQNADGEDDLFIYPIGAKLTDDILAQDADDHPKLQAVANWIRESGMGGLSDGPSSDPGETSASIGTLEEPGEDGESKVEPVESGAGDKPAGGPRPRPTESGAAKATPDPGKAEEKKSPSGDKAKAEKDKRKPPMDRETAERAREALQKRRKDAAGRVKKRSGSSRKRGNRPVPNR